MSVKEVVVEIKDKDAKENVIFAEDKPTSELSPWRGTVQQCQGVQYVVATTASGGRT